MVQRRRQQQLSDTIQQRARRIAASADVADIDRWWDRAGDAFAELVTRGVNASAGDAARYLRQHAQIEGVRLEPEVASANRDQIETSLRVTGPVEFKTHIAATGDEVASRRVMATTLSGSASRLTLGGGRNTITRAFSRGQITGWRRVTSADPCAFCSMLASRGAVYSRGTVDFETHDHCSCAPEPLYRRESEPPEVQQLRSEWDEHGGTLDRWRQYWDNRPAA